MGISFNDLCVDLQGEAADYGDTLPLEDWPVVFNLDGVRYHLRRGCSCAYFDKEAKEVVINIDN